MRDVMSLKSRLDPTSINALMCNIRGDETP